MRTRTRALDYDIPDRCILDSLTRAPVARARLTEWKSAQRRPRACTSLPKRFWSCSTSWVRVHTPDGGVRVEKAGVIGFGPTFADATTDWGRKFAKMVRRPKGSPQT